ncbi:hypothetical protein QVD17_16259 [Tagetes erecta]|uniref:Protein kinase domain-containing protein n=1 Tax=Tagetes erecta TaxID=13708 RepID=A0AAD8KUP7_TARER|nr:hypothetical protein QVD17_16259 [Tagetes erecta]
MLKRSYPHPHSHSISTTQYKTASTHTPSSSPSSSSSPSHNHVTTSSMADPISSLLSLILFFLLIPISFSSLPTLSISQITPNQTLICALTKSPSQQQTTLNCTTNNNSPTPSLPHINRFSFVAIAGGSRFLCGLSNPFLNSSSSPTSFLVCWRFFPNATTQFHRLYIGPPLKDLDSGDEHVCGIVSSTNHLLCWQWTWFNTNGFELNQTLITSSVSVGNNYVCGLSEFGQINCPGSNNFSSFNFPIGRYSAVSAGNKRVCAINSSNGLNCWGETMVSIPNGAFKSVSVGDNRFCAVRINGSVICWGEFGFELPENLRGVSFEGLEVNGGVFCGILTSNYSVYCWGNDDMNLNNVFVFANVVPGLCTSSCVCGPVVNYDGFCSGDLMICKQCDFIQPLPLPPPSPPPSPPRNGGLSDKMIAFVVVGSVGCLSFVLVICFIIFRFCKSTGGSRVHDSGPMDDDQIVSQIQAANRVLVKKLSHLISNGNGSHLEEYTLQTIIIATENFSDDHRIGVGSFGSVYHGLLPDGRRVAIKRAELTSSSSYPGGMNKQQEDTDNAFVNELEFLSRVNHKNLVRLLGFCEEETELVLVYEYMENGSLHNHLHKLYSSYIMSWPARIKVALDAARGLEYLHVYADPPIIHRDIKSSNILLDAEWTGKVSDFGLSLLGPTDNKSHLSLRAAGTVGYMDPAYYKFEQLTAKSDVYSFGVVLLELLSGHRAIHKNEVGDRRNVVDSVVPYIVRDDIHRILDPKVPPPTPFEIEAVKYVGYLAVDCVTLEGKDRPMMSEVVMCLERALTACLSIPSFSHSSNGST